ncbi:hypothetical protein IRJ41_017045 [Triplophysa rosa]|uniref:Uncharacterized protein n=1 Tax=Triplophysa rosa TaxID=992332 RepID=A0A9W7T971_TRIRA|nr:hypothetical protein IRJ41_017045 [Triplophysa rosa]
MAAGYNDLTMLSTEQGFIDIFQTKMKISASYQVNFIASLKCTMSARHMQMSGVVSGHAERDDIHMVSFLGRCFGFSNRRYSLKRRAGGRPTTSHLTAH